MARMLYSTLLRSAYRRLFGPLPDPPAEADETGLVLVADGVGGLDLCGLGLTYAVARAGLKHRVQVLAWGHGFGRWYRDLSNVANHARQAALLADLVRSYREAHPDRPVFLVGKSGGSGVVVRALEQLPADAVEAAVLLAPALSPGYDLSQALAAVRRELCVFWSPLDVIILGAGTRLFGTIDRVRCPAAGRASFRTPGGLDGDRATQYGKLRQVRWSPRMAPTGYLGGHVGPDSPAFLGRYVVPLFRAAPAAGAGSVLGTPGA